MCVGKKIVFRAGCRSPICAENDNRLDVPLLMLEEQFPDNDASGDLTVQ